MTMKSADLLIGELADHFAQVLDAVLPAGKLALVDFPDHSNVGDSAIWLGEMAYLRKARRLPAYDPEALADGLLMLIEGAYSTYHVFGSQGPAGMLVHSAGTLIDAHVAKRPQ